MSARARTILIGVVAAVLIALAWYFLLWSPQGKDLSTAKDERAAAETRRSELQTRLARLKRLEANQAQLESLRAQLATAIPDADQLDQFILEVNSRAAQAGVVFVSIAPQQPGAAAAAPGAPATGPTAIGLQIQATGDYFAVLRFMEALRDGPRLVTVETLALSPGGGPTPGGGQITASIGGRMFVSNQKSAAVPAATPSA